MKILTIRTLNLNSLYGHNEVSLTDGLGHASLFLIMGPTGAGKTTLLDAIMLALFGRTARLDSRRETSRTELTEYDPTNSMSWGTGECYAEVDFETLVEGAAIRFRARWQARRARKKPGGNMQSPIRSLWRLDEDGEVIESGSVSSNKKKDFEPAFDRALNGLTPAEFQRSVLLAQGDYAAFLRASDDERASVLERLVDTSRFRKIGERAFARWRDAKAEVERLEGRIGDVSVLQPEMRAELRARAQALDSVIKRTQEELVVARSWANWHGRMRRAREAERRALERVEEAVRRRESARERLAELEEFERLEPAFRAWDALLVARSEVATTEESEKQRAEELELAKAAVSDAREALDKALASHEATQRTYDQWKPRLARARKLEGARDAKSRELESVRSRLTQAHKYAEETGKELRNEAARLESARVRIGALDEKLKRGPDAQQAADQRDALTRLREQWKHVEQSVAGLEQELETRNKSAAQATRQVDELRERSAAAKSAEAASHESVESILRSMSANERVRAFAAGLSESGIAALSEATVDDRTTRERSAKLELERGLQLVRRRVEVFRELGDIERRRNECMSSSSEYRAQLDEHLSERERITGRLRVLDTTLEIFDRLVLHRDQVLEDGRECPLCGSTEHPYVGSPSQADEDEAARVARQTHQDEREELQASFELASKKRDDALAALAVLDERLDAMERESNSLRSQAGALDDELEGLTTRRPELPSAATLDRDDLGEVTTRLQAEITTSTAAIDALERLRRAVAAHHSACVSARGAQESLTIAEGALEERQRQIEASKGALESAERDRERLRQELEPLLEESSADERSVSFRIGRALERLHEVLRGHEEMRSLRDERAQAEERQRGLTETLQHRRSVVNRELEVEREAMSELDGLRATLEELLEGKSADHREHELSVQVRDSRGALAELEELHSDAREKLTRSMTLLEEARALLTDARRRLRDAEEALESALLELGLESDAALVARRLGAKDHAALSALRTELQDSLNRSTAVLDESRQQLAESMNEMPEGEEPPADSLADFIEEHESQLASQQQERGEVRQAIQSDEDSLRRLQGIRTELETARSDYDEWSKLKELIGKRDGRQFQEFAQSLTLEEIVNAANHNLERLTNRYRLAVARDSQGFPTLSFAIEDRYQANRERPITNLSGGETFLVSLALALGLAGQRKGMNIETLLLDEGFGTLDRDSLDVAVRALEQLQRERGAQVGIISHVEGLKERISARIVLEPVAEGRSKVRVEA